MKKIWTRLDHDDRCGQCGDHVLRDGPICLLFVEGVSRPLLRCENCAGPAPEDPRAVLLRERAELDRRKEHP